VRCWRFWRAFARHRFQIELAAQCPLNALGAQPVLPHSGFIRICAQRRSGYRREYACH